MCLQTHPLEPQPHREDPLSGEEMGSLYKKAGEPRYDGGAERSFKSQRSKGKGSSKRARWKLECLPSLPLEGTEHHFCHTLVSSGESVSQAHIQGEEN